jgi:murein peptide amidase A
LAPGFLIALIVGGIVLAVLAVSDRWGGVSAPPRVETQPSTPPSPLPRGESARGQPVRALAVGNPADRPLLLVVGCIHGNERAGTEVVRSIRHRAPSRGSIVAVPNLNPDGLAVGTRTNARGVDLNRNFGSGWRPIGAPGDPEHSGARPFSEPETRFARRLIRVLRPDATVWFHQQVEPPLVRAWGHSRTAARAYARIAGAPFSALRWQPGSAPNWQNHRFRKASSFVVELPWGEVADSVVRRNAAALLALVRRLERGA